jgi:hypothetical protein
MFCRRNNQWIFQIIADSGIAIMKSSEIRAWIRFGDGRFSYGLVFMVIIIITLNLNQSGIKSYTLTLVFLYYLFILSLFRKLPAEGAVLSIIFGIGVFQHRSKRKT